MKNFQRSIEIDLSTMRAEGFHSSVESSMQRINQQVNSSAGWVKINVCPVCGSSDSRSWLKKYDNQLVECSICTSGYSTRQPKDFNDAYNTSEHFTKSIASYDDNRDYRIKRFGKERLELIQKFKQKGKLLDIGCGTGWFIEAARGTFEVAGYEPAKNLAEFTSNKLGIHVATSLDEFEAGSIDIITAFDVIEHVPNPLDFIGEVYDLLKIGGIAVIFTPNKNSAAFSYMQEKQNLVVPPLHLHYLNSNSFKYLTKDKFDTLFEGTYGLDVGDIYAYERDFGDKEFSAFLKENVNIIQSFLDHTNLGNHLRVVIQKKPKYI